jgi:hypothetical protein
MSEQPPTYPSASPMPPAQAGSGMAIASLVLSIVSLVLFCLWFVSIPCAIVAIVLGIVARGKASRGEASGKGMATAGMVIGIITIAVVVVAVITGTWAAKKLGPEFQKAMEQEIKKQQQLNQSAPAQPASPQSWLDAVNPDCLA